MPSTSFVTEMHWGSSAGAERRVQEVQGGCSDSRSTGSAAGWKCCRSNDRIIQGISSGLRVHTVWQESSKVDRRSPAWAKLNWRRLSRTADATTAKEKKEGVVVLASFPVPSLDFDLRTSCCVTPYMLALLWPVWPLFKQLCVSATLTVFLTALHQRHSSGHCCLLYQSWIFPICLWPFCLPVHPANRRLSLSSGLYILDLDLA